MRDDGLLFKDGAVKENRLLRVRLVKPGRLRDELTYLVTMTISFVSPISATADMDLTMFLSDGVNAVGHEILDTGNYATFPPIRACQTPSGTVAPRNCANTGVRVTLDKSNEVVTASFNVGGNQPAFGEAHATFDREISVIHTYETQIQPSRGLYLEIYRDSSSEQYLIRFVKVKVEDGFLS